ncbi:MAG: hypothetical protein ACI8PD_002470, partial [Nitrospinales bacterium]
FWLHFAKEGTAWVNKTTNVKSTIRIFKLLRLVRKTGLQI